MEATSQISNTVKNVTGEYYLTGVMETASVISLKPDSTFLFYFSYGAAEREGSGTWTLRDSTLILNSKPRPGKDFRLIQSSRSASQQITITCQHPNPDFFSFLQCFLQTPEHQNVYKPTRDGILTIPSTPIDSIGFLFVICGDRTTWFKDLPKEHNNFIFIPEEWICNIYCSNLQLKFKDLGLIGEHPLLAGKQFIYQKN